MSNLEDNLGGAAKGMFDSVKERLP